MSDRSKKVKAANKELYDRLGSLYESLDGRRSESLSEYLKDQVRAVARPQSFLLDLGCGNGFVSKIVGPYFGRRFALDVSFNVIGGISDIGADRVQGDCDFLPFQDGVFDFVAAFALLHHCYAYGDLVGEVFRVLKKGGVFYSDHDMDESFFERFKPLIRLYRRIKGAHNRYKGFVPDAKEDLYACSEIHEDGIPSDRIDSLLQRAGFESISIDYHWYGLTDWTNIVFGKRKYEKGGAPLVRIFAVK